MELLHVQGSKNNMKVVGDYLGTDGPFEGKNEHFNPDPEL
jgi:hypothetical protein